MHQQVCQEDASFLTGLIDSLIAQFFELFAYLDIKPVSCIAGEDFLPFCMLSIGSVDSLFSCTITFLFHDIPLVVCLNYRATGVFLLKVFPYACCVLPSFSSSNFRVSGLILRSLMH